MKISYDVALPERHNFKGGAMSPEAAAIEEFLKGTRKNMCFMYDTAEEAKRRLGSIQGYRRKSKHGDLYDIYRHEAGLYVVRLDPKTVKERRAAATAEKGVGPMSSKK